MQFVYIRKKIFQQDIPFPVNPLLRKLEMTLDKQITVLSNKIKRDYDSNVNSISFHGAYKLVNSISLKFRTVSSVICSPIATTIHKIKFQNLARMLTIHSSVNSDRFS